MSAACPQCPSGEGSLLGSFGAAKAYRCRACGWTWSHLPKPRRVPIKPTTRHSKPARRDLVNATKETTA